MIMMTYTHDGWSNDDEGPMMMLTMAMAGFDDEDYDVEACYIT